MLFGKSERKKHTAPVILTVDALAAIGAISITRSGKQMVKNTVAKAKNLFNKEISKMTDENKYC